jgi:CysZ protein
MAGTVTRTEVGLHLQDPTGCFFSIETSDQNLAQELLRYPKGRGPGVEKGRQTLHGFEGLRRVRGRSFTIFTCQKYRLLRELVIAVQGWEAAHRFIRKHGSFRLILVPGIVYTLLFIAGMFFFWRSSDTVVSWVSDRLGIETWLQRERSPWLSFLFVMNGMMLRLTLLLFYFSFFKYLILIAGSPLFAYLSERAEAIIEGRTYRYEWAAIRGDCIRSISLDLRNCGWQSVYLVGLILLSLVPVAGWITPIIALLLECYYFGFSMLDYNFARASLTPAQSLVFTSRHKGLAIGNGFLFYLMHALIVLAPAYAVIAATCSVHQIKKN